MGGHALAPRAGAQAALQSLSAIRAAGNVQVTVPTGSAVGGTGAAYYVVTFVGAPQPEPAIISHGVASKA